MRYSVPSSRLWGTLRLSLLTAALFVWMMAPTVTWAHPLGNFTLNHYNRIELSPGQLRLLYVLDMAEIPTVQTVQRFDQDGDGQLNSGESVVFASDKLAKLSDGLQVRINGQRLQLHPGGTPELSVPPGQAGLSTLRLSFWLSGDLPVSPQGSLRAEFENGNDAGRLGWREIVVTGADGVKIADSTASATDTSDELRSYPEDMLTLPLNQTNAQFTLSGGSTTSRVEAGVAPRQTGAAANDGAFAELITLPTLTLSAVLWALALAFGLGALHALEPGHGKTLAAAYLVGSRATPWHAVVLGLSVTVTHTASIFLLGLVTLFLSDIIVPERLLPWLGLASGLLVIGLGIQMTVSRLRARPFAGALSHSHDGLTFHSHGGGQPHHHHATTGAAAGEAMGWRSTLMVGISGGLLPCPAALVVLLSAIGLGRLSFGLLLIVAFSAGLAGVLSVIGLITLYGRRWLQRTSRFQSSAVFAIIGGTLPVLGALLVVGAGILLLYHALPVFRIWQL
jgi:nickel/cobalt exporter